MLMSCYLSRVHCGLLAGIKRGKLQYNKFANGMSTSDYTNGSLGKNPRHVDALSSLGAIGVLKNNNDAMHHAENTLRSTKCNSKTDKTVRRLLMEISRSQGRNVDDVSRVGIMLNPSSAWEWTNLSRGDDASAHLAMKLAQRDQTLNTEEFSATYEKSGSLGAIQSGILLSPWRIQGWQILKSHK